MAGNLWLNSGSKFQRPLSSHPKAGKRHRNSLQKEASLHELKPASVHFQPSEISYHTSSLKLYDQLTTSTTSAYQPYHLVFASNRIESFNLPTCTYNQRDLFAAHHPVPSSNRSRTQLHLPSFHPLLSSKHHPRITKMTKRNIVIAIIIIILFIVLAIVAYVIYAIHNNLSLFGLSRPMDEESDG